MREKKKKNYFNRRWLIEEEKSIFNFRIKNMCEWCSNVIERGVDKLMAI